MMTTAVTTLTTLGDDWQKFSTTQLKDELVFKEGRDVLGRNQGLGNNPSQFVRIFGLVSLSVEIGFL
jgi:hypothetical protein